jgi:hypothetical protein
VLGGILETQGLSFEFSSATSGQATLYNIHIQDSVLYQKIILVHHKGDLVIMATKLLRLHT